MKAERNKGGFEPSPQGMTPDELIQSEQRYDDDDLPPTQVLFHYEGPRRKVKGERMVKGAGDVFTFERLTKEVATQVITFVNSAGELVSRAFHSGDYPDGVRPQEDAQQLRGGRKHAVKQVKLNPNEAPRRSFEHALHHASSARHESPTVKGGKGRMSRSSRGRKTS